MTFIPHVHVPNPPPSPRARELAKRLRETIDNFTIDHPDLSSAEIQQAAAMATHEARPKNIALVVSALVGIVALIIGVLVFLNAGSGWVSVAMLVGMLAVAVILAGVVAVVVSLSRSR